MGILRSSSTSSARLTIGISCSMRRDVIPSFRRQQLMHYRTRLIQVLIAAVLGDLAGAQHQGLVEPARYARPVQHPDHSPSQAFLKDRVVDLALARAVETGSRL